MDLTQEINDSALDTALICLIANCRAFDQQCVNALDELRGDERAGPVAVRLREITDPMRRASVRDVEHQAARVRGSLANDNDGA